MNKKTKKQPNCPSAVETRELIRKILITGTGGCAVQVAADGWTEI